MQSQRNPLIDLLRGVAIFVVLLLHFHLTYHLDGGVKFLKPIFNNGNYGVVMFFVISGFLITSTTLKRFGELANVDLRAFYSFRVGRIAPNILLMLTIVVVLGLCGVKIFQNDASGPSLWITILSVLTFTHNWLMEKYGYFNYCLNILWSLSVEEVFYLVFPLICILPRKSGLALWGFVILISPIYRYIHRNDSIDIFGLYDYLACFDGLAIGCLAAVVKRSMKRSIPKWIGPLAGVLIAVIYYQGIWNHVVLGISAVSLLTGVILFGKGERIPGFTRPLRFLGQYSYELYLFHIIILALMKTAVKAADLNPYTKLLWLLFFFAISAVVAVWISKYYSEPLNRKIRTSCFGSAPASSVLQASPVSCE